VWWLVAWYKEFFPPLPCGGTVFFSLILATVFVKSATIFPAFGCFQGASAFELVIRPFILDVLRLIAGPPTC